MCDEERKDVIDNILRHTKIKLEAECELEQNRQCGIFAQNKEFHEGMVELHNIIDEADVNIASLKDELFKEFAEK